MTSKRLASIQDYVQAIFAKVNPGEIETNRPERLNVRIIQSPEPDAYMLPNGAMLVSTGLLCPQYIRPESGPFGAGFGT